MIYPQVPCKEWAEKYSIRIRSGKCCNCGIEVFANIPFALKGYRGLKSEDHGCGEEYTKKVLKPWSEDEKEFWKNIARNM